MNVDEVNPTAQTIFSGDAGDSTPSDKPIPSQPLSEQLEQKEEPQVEVESVDKVGTSEVNEEPKPPAQPQLTPEHIAKAVSTALQGVQAQQPQQPQQITQEEYDRIFKPYKPDQRVVERLLTGGEEAVAALNEVVQGVSEHANRMAQYHAFVLNKKMNEFYKNDIAPKLTQFEQAQVQRVEQESSKLFFEEYPELNTAYAKIVLDKVRQDIVNEGKQFADYKSAFKEVATRTKEVLKSIPGYAEKTNTPNVGQGSKPLQKHSMPTTSLGGQGGGTNKSGAPSGVHKTAYTIFRS